MPSSILVALEDAVLDPHKQSDQRTDASLALRFAREAAREAGRDHPSEKNAIHGVFMVIGSLESFLGVTANPSERLEYRRRVFELESMLPAQMSRLDLWNEISDIAQGFDEFPLRTAMRIEYELRKRHGGRYPPSLGLKLVYGVCFDQLALRSNEPFCAPTDD